MSIKLQKEIKERALVSIKRYFEEIMDESIGDLKAGLLLEFILKEIGPSVYNQAIADAQTFMHDRLTDLECTCTEPEFEYFDHH